MPKYIWERGEWPNLTFDSDALLNPLAETVEHHGLLLGRLEALGFADLQSTKLDALSTEVAKSSEIEGEVLDYDAVRSLVAQMLRMEKEGATSANDQIEGAVAMVVDAAENWNEPLDKDRLLNWYAGQWRDDAQGPMRVVSGRVGHPRVHFEAPPAAKIEAEMRSFFKWFEYEKATNGILKAGIAHLWFMTIHPFEDGNGRIGRTILDLALARYDQREWRCYSVSSQIHQEQKSYFDALEAAQKSTTDVTAWLTWYLGCLGRAFQGSGESVAAVVARGKFWQKHAGLDFNERQRKVLQKMLTGWEGKMTNRKWQVLAGCTVQTAFRDLAELVQWEVFARDEAGGRGTAYTLVD